MIFILNLPFFGPNVVFDQMLNVSTASTLVQNCFTMCKQLNILFMKSAHSDLCVYALMSIHGLITLHTIWIFSKFIWFVHWLKKFFLSSCHHWSVDGGNLSTRKSGVQASYGGDDHGDLGQDGQHLQLCQTSLQDFQLAKCCKGYEHREGDGC